MGGSGQNRVRSARLALGMSQAALAAATRLSRQSIGAIEAGRATPAVDVALRIATTLELSVEELFGARSPEAPLVTEATSRCATERVALAQIAGRWLSYGLDGEAMWTAADGLLSQAGEAGAGRRARAPRGSVPVDPVRPLEEVHHNLVLMGCAVGLGLLADRLNSRPGAGRFLWLSRSSTDALSALARRQTHLAGVHLTDEKTGEPNVADVRRHQGREPVTLITFARWEAGLVTARGNPKQIRSSADLGRRGLRCVVRESGSGARRVLDRELGRAGLPRELATQAPLQARGHLQVALAISMGAADVGVATRDAALAFGLHFVPLSEERYDLVVPRSALEDPRVQRLFDTLSSSVFQRELACLGYEVTSSGERVAELSAA
ncbi:MAG TPA: substrate-binding domain-containing protein [Polyangiaceae bacterium]|nr:substrate-binding domain-containing protein [Polyangiaceae bacterium]